MFNESNTEESALPMWWDGTKLRFDEIPRNTEQNRKSNSLKINKKISEENKLKEISSIKK